MGQVVQSGQGAEVIVVGNCSEANIDQISNLQIASSESHLALIMEGIMSTELLHTVLNNELSHIHSTMSHIAITHKRYQWLSYHVYKA